MIGPEYITFFLELEQNNDRKWFHANKKRYEAAVKTPFLELIRQWMERIAAFDSDITMTPKETLFRINRDVRFSKDKSPYNVMMKASIAPGGRKSASPGYYLGISADHIHLGGGLFMVEKNQLIAVREHILNQRERFEQIINANSFKSRFGSLQGERAKRYDAKFKVMEGELPEIANKQFYAMAQYPVQDYLQPGQLLALASEHAQEVAALNTFLKEAIGD